MNRSFLIFLLFSCSVFNVFSQYIPSVKGQRYSLVVHGGAGNFTSADISSDDSVKFVFHLNRALTIGDSILANNGTALDAVESVIVYLEDCPLFNAGKGAVFNHDGKNELDASIMDGKTGKAGAVAGITDIKNPIKAARSVMDSSEHVMMIGSGASVFAEINGLEIVDETYFRTEKSWERLQKALAKEKNGTVGCVALDSYGNISAGTSTGGMTNKRYGRVGDSPVIGAGTFASNNTCGVSCTGHGEFFIRYCVAHDISAQMEYLKNDLKTAAANVIHNKLKPIGGDGGIIAIDKEGNICMDFNTTGMFRAYTTSIGNKSILFY